MKIINNVVTLGVTLLLSACGGSGGGSGSGSAISHSAVSSISSVGASSTSSAEPLSSSVASSSVSAALYPSYNTDPIVPDMAGMESNATQLASKFKLGVNIGGRIRHAAGGGGGEECRHKCF